MAYPIYKATNTSDFSDLLIYSNSVTSGYFMQIILFGFFAVLFLATYNLQKRNGLRGDFPSAFSTAAFLTLGLAIIFSLKDGLINVITLSIWIAITILSVVFLYFSND